MCMRIMFALLPVTYYSQCYKTQAANGGKHVEVKLKDKLTGVKEISNGDAKVTLTKSEDDKPATVSVNNAKITKVANGEVSETSTDAVNGSQLFEVQQGITNIADGVNQNAKNINKLGKRVAFPETEYQYKESA